MTTEIGTFSAAVDDLLLRASRQDRRADAMAYIRTTIRECQVKAYFKNDFIEDTVTSDASPFVWTYPQEFRIISAVRYPVYNGRGQRIYPREIKPGLKQREEIYYYYGGPGYYTFAGLDSGAAIDLGYYVVAKKLPYYAIADRPATFDLDTDAWIYPTSLTPAEELTAREQVSNWLLLNYYDTIVEGGLAKLYKSIGDPRAGSTYALYKSLQSTLLETEPADNLDR